MLVARSHISCEKDPAVAARDLADGLGAVADGSGARAAIFFATEDYGPAYERISREIASRADIGCVVGCSAESVLPPPDRPSEGRGISAIALSGLEGVERFFLHGLRGRSVEVGREIGRLVASEPDLPATVWLLTDTYNLAPDELLAGIAEIAGRVPVVGAGATEKGSTGETTVVAHGTSSSNAVCGLVLRGVAIRPIRSPVYTAVGPGWTITRGHTNRIELLDGLGALECLLESLPDAFREDPDAAIGRIHVALSEPEAPEAPLFRPIVGGDVETGALLIGDEVRPGMRLSIAAPDPVRARERLEDQLGRLAETPDLAGVLYAHGGLGEDAPYGIPDIDAAYLRRHLGDTPVAGFGSFVTFSPHRGRNRFHHFSGLLAGLAPAGSMSEEEIWAR